MKNRCFLYVLAAAVVHTAAAVCAEPPRAKPVEVSVDETARFLAGLPPVGDPLLLELADQATWQRHAEVLDDAWAGFEEGRLSKVREWSAAHIPVASKSGGTLFYMFSGPDFLFADAIYPGAGTYVFCGVEPVGPIPDLTKLRRNQIPRELQALRSSIDSILSFSFFLTKEMKTDLRNHALSGALPIIAIFMARAGKTITGIEFVGLDEEGALHAIDAPERGDGITAPGVKISFRGGVSNKVRTLYYFSTDISDGGFNKNGFRHFCRDLAPGNGLVKSASYLMHKSYFSQVRSFLLENTDTLVQDPSGIPVTYFKAEQWNLRPFGHYPGPISLFAEHAQPKLFELYRKGDPVPLDFGIGYRHRKGESSLVVAERRRETPVADAPKALAVTNNSPKAVPVTQDSPKAIPVQKAIPVADANVPPEPGVEPGNQPVAQ